MILQTHFTINQSLNQLELNEKVDQTNFDHCNFGLIIALIAKIQKSQNQLNTHSNAMHLSEINLTYI